MAFTMHLRCPGDTFRLKSGKVDSSEEWCASHSRKPYERALAESEGVGNVGVASS